MASIKDHAVFSRGPASLLTLLLVSLLGFFAAAAHASDGRILGKEEIVLYGMQLTAAPAKQTVPKNIATIVSTYMQVPSLPQSQIPPLPADAVVRATLRGPGLPDPIELEVQANSPFNVPPMTVPGIYSLDNIRMVAGGEVLFHATPESVTIEVIEKLLVTQVSARPLTAQEIRDRGIVFDKSNFQAYNFTAAFAVAPGREINISMPVILPNLQGTQDVRVDGVNIPSVQGAQLASVATIIPDALKLAQTTVPNLNVQAFTLKPDLPEANNFYLPPIPGVVVIPGDIGFLNQYFSVMLMVGNAAPADSNLVVKDLRAQIVLPAGRDEVVSTGDDPLRMALTDRGEAPRVIPVAKPGPDGKLGTGDDIDELAPGESGNAEYLVEGRREGSHTVEMEITGTLYGLPIGPVPVRGRAMGTVLVRNPTFTMTFTHPDIVSAGEKYTLDVTVTNTSESPANFVSVNLAPRYISGAQLVGEPSRSIESIPPGDSATVSFDLLAQVSGNVFAATLDSDEQIQGRFLLKTSVGELGIPLSPDSLVLPKEASALPKNLRDAVLGMLGKAYATATAPTAALPKDVLRFGKKIVWDRGIEAAEAGFRYSMGAENFDPAGAPGEKLNETASQLLMDFMGSNFSRIGALYKTDAEREAARTDFTGFDDLRRRSLRGDVLAAAVAELLQGELQSKGTASFHSDLAGRLSYRPGFVSILARGDNGALPVTLRVTDRKGRVVGGADAGGKSVKQIPFSDLLLFRDASGATGGELAILAAPEAAPDHGFNLAIEPVPGALPGERYTLSLVYPAASGELRQVSWSGLRADEAPLFAAGDGDPFPVTVTAAGPAVAATASAALPDPPPSIVAVVQQAKADVHKCDRKDPGQPLGRVVAILFSEEVTPESVQDKLEAARITNFSAEENLVVGVALQPGRRIAYLALRDPLGPFVARSITVANVADLKGHAMESQTLPMLSTIESFGGVVSGRILQADGLLVPGSEIRLVLQRMCPDAEDWIDVGIAAKLTDANAHYQWDYVRGGEFRVKQIALNNETGDVRRLIFSLARNGQRLNADMVFLGRGTVQGRAFGEDGVTPLKDVHVKITSLIDQTAYGAVTDSEGRYLIARVPVGNSLLEAVHAPTNSQVAQSVYIGTAGSVIDMDLLLLTEAVKRITVQYGEAHGNVLRPDGATAVPNVPVIAWYQNNSQPGVSCPGNPAPPECPVAMVNTDANGSYSFPMLTAGALRLSSFDQGVYQQGEIRVTLAPDGRADGNILLNGGFGTVRGTVRNADGSPVAGAQVGGGLVLATTDAGGNFELRDVPVGHAQIVAVSQEQGASGKTEVDIVRGGEIVNAAIVLSAVGGVYGVVYQAPDQAGNREPAAGIDVFAMRPGEGGMSIVGSAVTDSQGRYQIAPLEVMKRDEYTVSAFTSDLSDGNLAKTKVVYNGHQSKVDITFKGKGSVAGTVFDDDGVTPLKARVSVSGLTVRHARGPAGKLVGLDFVHTQHLSIVDTDFTTGAYSFDGVFVGPIVITAGGAFSPDPITAADEIAYAGERRVIDLRLVATSVINGRVMLPDGFTPAGVAVAVEFKSTESKTFCKVNQTTGEDSCETIPQGIQSEIVHTLEDGSFQVPLVNAGGFTLTATDPVSGKTGTMKGWVGAGQTAEVKLRLLGQGAVTVQATGSDGATAIPGARVTLEQGEFPKQKKTGYADALGRITFQGIDEGPFAVLVLDMRNGFTGRGSGKLLLDGGQVSVTVHLDDATGTVRGTVYRPDGLTPVANAEIAIFNQTGPLAFNVTDAAGAYSQDTIPLGAVNVRVFEASTGRRGAGSGSVDYPGEIEEIVVTEAAVGHVRGKLYDAATMQTLRGWQVRLGVTFPDGNSLSLIGTTGVDGGFFFPGVPQGEFTLHASREELGSATAGGTIVRENELVDIPMLVSLAQVVRGSVHGFVIRPDGSPAPDYEICIDPTEGGCVHNATAASDGTFTVTDLSLGRHLVLVSAQAQASRGSALFEVEFAGAAAVVKVIVNTVSGVDVDVVEFDNSPAASVNVTLEKYPDAGCGKSRCSKATDAAGHAVFDGVPAGNFTVWAEDPLRTLGGAASGTLVADARMARRVVLQPSGTVSGTVLYPDQQRRAGIIVELTDASDAGHLYYGATDASGAFALRGVKLGDYGLSIVDPLGSGMAQRFLTVSGNWDGGTIILDDAPPTVRSVDPMPGTVKVPLNQAVNVLFSENINPGSVSDAAATLSSGSEEVAGTLSIGSDSILFTPVAQLKEQTTYTLKVSGITDNFNRPMEKAFLSTFTTVDLTPPALLTLSPEPDTSGAPLESVIRVTFNEPLDPAGFTAPAIRLTRNGVEIEGRVDLIFGNTCAVFTPKYPLAEGSSYLVEVQRATDLSGNRQPLSREYAFNSTDRNPPVIAELTRSNAGNVIESAVAGVSAILAGASDVAYVDFFLNDVMSHTDRQAPFDLSFQAVPSYGAPGTLIKVGAIATDTSGNRGPVAETMFTIVADTPPTVSITSPASGSSFRTGERVAVSVAADDDLGVVKMGYQAYGGLPPASQTDLVAPEATSASKSFAFYVPADAVPGSSITVHALAADNKGQATRAVPVLITVLDATAPTVGFTGLSSGQKVVPGQAITAVVSASDLGKIARLQFTVAGATVHSESRVIEPALSSVASSFGFVVSGAAAAGETADLSVTAWDAAGNFASAGPVKLPVADVRPPSVTSLRVSDNSTEIVPNQQFTVIVEASDNIGVQSISISGTGAFGYPQRSQGITPPLGSASAQFTVTVPAGVADGSVLRLSASATDTSNSTGEPRTLELTVRSTLGVTLPASQVLNAGEARSLALSLTAPAPAGGVRVDLASANPGVVTVSTPVLFAAGEQVKSFEIAAVRGGNTQVGASIAGAAAGAMSVAVNGGIVTGTVYNPYPKAVAGAEVVVNGFSQVTGADGRFSFAGIAGPGVTVRVNDPVSKLKGYATGSMNASLGYLHDLQVQLVPAGSINGAVRLADGATPAGAGVRVELFAASDLNNPVDVTFTDQDSLFAFPMVTVGSYAIVAQNGSGDRGRSTASIIQSGQELNTLVTYLGKGSVTVTVYDSSDNTVSNASLSFTSRHVFGSSTQAVSAGSDGSYTFSDVFLGDFYVNAKDEVTGLGAGGSGTLTVNGQQAALDLRLAAYGSIEGHVYRADGTTPAAGVKVTAGSASTTSDPEGSYRLEILPLGIYAINANDAAARSKAQGSVALQANGAVMSVNLNLSGQGSVLATVTDDYDEPVPNATVTLNDGYGNLSETTDGNGQAVFNKVMAGGISATARGLGLVASASGTAVSGATAQLSIQLLSVHTDLGSFTGTVFAPDGLTPLEGMRAELRGVSVSDSRNATTATDGSYSFPDLKMGTYNLFFYDETNALRAKRLGAILLVDQQVERVDATFVGIGTVSGRVLKNGNVSAGGIRTTVQSLNPDFGRSFTAITDPAGYYQVERVPVGRFAVTAGDAANQLLGEALGELPAHNAAATADLILLSNAFTPPRTLSDGNLYRYDIQADATVASGNSVFSGAAVLEVGGARFTGDNIGTQEDQSRELSLRQLAISGLNVTRKVFVPREGYFARYLEILSNPTASDITVELRVKSNLSSSFTPIATSSGDATLSREDQWASFDDNNASYPAVALVFGGSIQPTSAGFASGSPAVATATWGGVTVPAGQSVTLMHFVVQQTGRDAARLAAERLTQLPPEALTGLSLEEITAISNFSVPADGSSPVAALPGMASEVIGQVLASDGATAAGSGAQVYLASTHPLFARSWQTTTDGFGRFRFATDYANAVFPAADFNLSARLWRSAAVDSPTVPGSFEAGRSSAVKDVVFSNTGIIHGAVTDAGGQPAGWSTFSLTQGGWHVSTTTGVDATYRFAFMPAGNYTSQASLASAQGSAAQAAGSASVSAGTDTEYNLAFPAQGTVAGSATLANGSRAVNAQVRLVSGSFVRATATDANGGFTLYDVPVGSYTLTVTEPVTGLTSSVPVTVTAGATTSLSVTFPMSGKVTGTLYFADGSSAVAGASVQVFDAAGGAALKSDGTASNGAYDSGFFTSGAANLRVAASFSYSTGSGNRSAAAEQTIAGLTGSAQTLSANLALPVNRSAIRAVVRMNNGALLTGDSIRIEARYPDDTLAAYCMTSSSTAECIMQNVVADAAGVRVRAIISATSLQEQPVAFTASNTTSTVELTLPIDPVILPKSLYDGNAAPHDVQADGSIRTGLNALFTNSAKGGAALEIVSGTTVTPFAGGLISVMEDQGREFLVRQDNLAGLSVGRKVFVPRDGYFARYLELLTNPTAAPITVSVRLRSNFSGNNATVTPVLTSSGGSTPAAGDLWAVVDDDALEDPFLFAAGNLPPAGFVWQGTGAAIAARPSFTLSSGLEASFEEITIEPGQTVALMHFVTQQSGRPGAQASAERLAQLPPEALAGMSSLERGEVLNFAVPADGAGTLAALPALNGSVAGRVSASDGSAAPAGSKVTFRSDNPYYGRGYTVKTGLNGAYAIGTNLVNSADSTGIVRDGFTLQAEVQVGAPVASPVVQGSFALPAASVPPLAYDLQGDVNALAANPNGQWRYGSTPAAGGLFTLYTYQTLGASGIAGYSLNNAPPSINYNTTAARVVSGSNFWNAGDVTVHPGPSGERSVIRWTAPISGSFGLAVSFDAHDTRPATTDVRVQKNGVDLFTGNVNSYPGTVNYNGSVTVAAGDTIDLAVGRGSNDYSYDTTGVTASYTLQSLTAEAAVFDIVFGNTGQVSGQAQLSGSAASDATVRVQNGAYATQGATGADGSFTFRFLPPGDYALSALKAHPQGSGYAAAATAAVSAGATTVQNLAFPTVGTLSGSVGIRSGEVGSEVTAIARALVTATATDFNRAAYSGSVVNGISSFTLDGLPAGTYSITAYSPTNGVASLPLSVTVVEGVNAPLAIEIPATGSAYKVWDGGANTVNWGDASNWSGNVAPGASDDVYIPAGIAVNYTTTATVKSLSGEGTLNLNSGTLTPTQSSSIRALNLAGGTLTVNTPAVFTVQNYNQGSGTLNGSGSIVVNGPLSFTGGTIAGSGETVANGGVHFGPGSDKWVRGGRRFTNNGKATVAATVYMYNDGTPPVFNNPAGSVIDFTADVGLDYSSSVWTLNNAGTVRKSAGTGTAWISATQNNTGRLEVLSGRLDLWGAGGSYSGAATASQGTTLAFRAGTHTLAAASTVSGAGQILSVGGTANVNGGYAVTGSTDVAGGTLNFNGAAATTRILNLASGTLGGSGTLTVNGPFTFSGGTMRDNGETVANGGMVFAAGSDKWVRYGTRRLTNNGVAAVRSNVYFYNDGALPIFNNNAGAVLDFVADVGLDYYSSAWTINNAGTIRKSAGTGTAWISGAHNNSGRIEVLSGRLDIWGAGGTHSGTLSAAQGSILSFRAGTHALTAESALSGAGQILSVAGTANVNGGYAVSGTTEIAGGTMNFNSAQASTNLLKLSSGTLGGSGRVTASGLFTFSGGTMRDNGETVANGGILFAAGSDKWVRNGARTLTNNGTATVMSPVYFYYDGAAPVFNNPAGSVIDLAADVNLDYSNSAWTLNNAGTIRKSAGTGNSLISGAQNDSGRIEVLSGTLQLSGSGTHSSAISVAQGTTLGFVAGTHTLSAASSVTGAGNVRETAGTLNLNGAFDLAGELSTTGGTFNLNSSGSAGSCSVSAGTMNVASGQVLAAGTVNFSGGILGGAGGITADSFNWSGGNLTGTGNLTVAQAGSIAITGTAQKWVHSGYTLNNGGTATLGGTSYIYFYNGTINNLAGAVFDITGDRGMTYSGGTFNNAGILRKSAGSGNAAFDATVLNNSGSVELQAGTFSFNTGGTQSGSFTGAEGTLYSFNGTHNFQAASSLSGYNVNFLGTTTLNGSFAPTNSLGVGGGITSLNRGLAVPTVGVWGGTLNVAAGESLAAQTVNLSGGVLGGAGAITAGTLNWSGGNLTGTGNLTVAAPGTIAITGTAQKWLHSGYTLNNGGTATLGGTSYIYFYNGTINNLAGAVFDITGDRGMTYSGGTFNNLGTLRKSAGTGNSAFDATAMNNSGSVELQSGSFSFNTAGTHTGSFTGAAGTTYNFSSAHNFQDASSLAGYNINFHGNTTLNGAFAPSNSFGVVGGTTNLNSGLTVPTLGVSGGTLNVAAGRSLAAQTVNLSSGNLGGAGSITADAFNWSGGNLAGTGSLSVPSTGAIAITGSTKWISEGFTLNNGGSATMGGSGYIYFNNGSINNLAGALFELTSDVGTTYSNGAFNNAGTVRKSGGAGNSAFDATAFTNSGTIELISGNLSANLGITQNAGSIALNGRTLGVGGSGLNLNAGSLTGPGIVSGSVRNAGGVTTGGVLNVTGSYLQTAAGTLNTAISGTTGYDQLRVSGAATFAGNLALTWGGGFTPAVSDTFDVVTYASKSGVFGRVTGNHIGGNAFHASYPSGKVTLVGSALGYIGTVHGTVTDADGAPLASAAVEITDAASGLMLAAVLTGTNGGYALTDLDPSGSFTLRVTHPASQSVTVERSFTFDANDQVLTFDVTMPGIPTTLSQSRYDANGFYFDIGSDLALEGSSSLFYQSGSPYRGGARLIVNGTLFAGGSSPTSEAAGRELAVREDGLSSLNVQRKVYIPQDGYFARYLEIFHNPGSTPVTLPLTLQNKFNYYYAYINPVITSSGDAVFQPGSTEAGGDTWGIFDDSDLSDPLTNGNYPPAAFIWGGGGAGSVSPASFSVTSSGGYNVPASFTVNYGELTIPPGESIALMHFVVQQTSRGAAQASAERLVQLPPEAIAYLTPAERVMVKNFAVPAASGLAPLPQVNGTVTATVTAADGVTPVPNASVSFKSTLPYYSRTMSSYTNAQGQVTFTGTNYALARADYTLNSSLNIFNATINAPQVTGSFAADSASSSATVVFTGTARLNAHLLRADGTAYTGASLTAKNASSLLQNMRETGDGYYTLPVIPAGTYTAYVDINPSQSSGTAYRVTSGSVDIAAGDTGSLELQVPPLGSISGSFRTQAGGEISYPYSYAYLSGRTTGISRYYYMYYLSSFSFDQLPPDTYDLWFSYNGTHYYSVTLASGQSLAQDFTMHNVGTIAGNVYLADGTTPAGANLEAADQVSGRSLATAYSDSYTGAYTMANVASDSAIRLRASYYYAGDSLTVDQFIPPFTSNGQTVTQNVNLPLYKVNLQVRLVDSFGTPLNVYYVPLSLTDVSSGRNLGNWSMYYGSRDINNIMLATAGVRVQIEYGGVTYSATVNPTANGATIPVNIAVPLVSGTVSGTVYAADGATRVPSANVSVYAGGSYLNGTSTDALGNYTIGNLNVTTDSAMTVRASTSGASGEVSFNFASSSSATIDVTLPLSIVQGTVFQYDGVTPVPWPTVTARQLVNSGEGPYTATFYGSSDDQGRYRILGLNVGDFTVNANDSNTGLTGTTGTQTLAELTTPFSVDLNLGPAGTVRGSVYDASSPVAGATVYLTILPGGFMRSATTAADGSYLFLNVPVGDFTAYAQLSPRQSPSVSGNVAQPGGEASGVDLNLPPFATVEGYAYDNLGAPLANLSVRIYNTSNGQNQYVTTDATGFFRSATTTAGSVTVSASYNNWTGSSSGTATGGDVTSLNLSLSSYNLNNGFIAFSSVTDATQTTDYRFDINSGGYLNDGGAVNPSLSDSYDGAYYLSVNGSSFNSSSAAFELANRQIVIGPQTMGGLRVVRKIYVPTAGGYARYLEMVTNTSTTANATVTVDVTSNLGSDGGTRFLVLPDASGNRYAVSYESGRGDASLAHVYASTAGAKPTATQFTSGSDGIFYKWDGVSIPPGETRCVMHYAVQRKPYDEAVAQTQAQALGGFGDPSMLFGLTVAEQDCAINFLQ